MGKFLTHELLEYFMDITQNQQLLSIEHFLSHLSDEVLSSGAFVCYLELSKIEKVVEVSCIQYTPEGKDIFINYEKPRYVNYATIQYCLRNGGICDWKKRHHWQRHLSFPDTQQWKKQCRKRSAISFCYKRSKDCFVTYLTLFDPRNRRPMTLQLIHSLLPFVHKIYSKHYTSTQQIFTTTSREKEVFRWIKEGKTYWEIGEILSISERTVRFHVANVTKKVNACNMTQALVKLMQTNEI